MKVNTKSQLAQWCVRKTILFLAFTVIMLNANAQRSGLVIGILADQNIVNGKGGLPPATASLRKIIVKEDINLKNLLPNAQKELPETKEETAAKDSVVLKGSKKINPIKDFAAPVTVTSGTIYDIAGNTALNQYTSLQANFQLSYYNGSNRSQASPVSVIELYKLEKGSTTRSFCIPSGGCASANIPILITASGGTSVAGAGGSAIGNILYKVTFPNGGYLQPGEYAFIDKLSLITDASALVCFTFTVKQ